MFVALGHLAQDWLFWAEMAGVLVGLMFLLLLGGHLWAAYGSQTG